MNKAFNYVHLLRCLPFRSRALADRQRALRQLQLSGGVLPDGLLYRPKKSTTDGDRSADGKKPIPGFSYRDTLRLIATPSESSDPNVSPSKEGPLTLAEAQQALALYTRLAPVVCAGDTSGLLPTFLQLLRSRGVTTSPPDVDSLTSPSATSQREESIPFTFPIPTHMIDSFGHVNNAKYLELYEYARWYLHSLDGSVHYFTEKEKHHHRKVFYVVSDASVQYYKEIPPHTKVILTAQKILPPGKQNGEERFDRMNREMVLQCLYGETGVLYSSAILQLAAVGPVSLQSELIQRYGSVTEKEDYERKKSETAGKPKRMVGLNTLYVDADICGLNDAREMYTLLQHSTQQALQAGEGDKPLWLGDLTTSLVKWKKASRTFQW